jgi:SAM-dependent methyltransferase
MTARLHNRTRRSASIPRTLLRRGRALELPLYYVLRLSDLAREGLERSGSHRFADHIYRNEPSGRGVVGRWLDARLLGLPAVRSFRSRYLAARDEIARTVVARLRDGGTDPIRVLSVPCGIPRELADAAGEIRRQLGELPDRVEFHGIDLDGVVLAEACAFAESRGLRSFRAHQGDALSSSSYPTGMACVTSTGLAEFLDDEEVVQLYAACYRALVPGGLFVSSGMQGRRLSEYLLRLAEIRTHYRGSNDLARLARRVPFREVHVRGDGVGLQTILTATA